MTIRTLLRARVLPLLLVLAVAALAIAACDNGGNGDDADTNASPTAADMAEGGDSAAADGAEDDTADGAVDGDADGETDGETDGGTADEPPPEDGAGEQPTDGDGTFEIRMVQGIQFDPTQVMVPAGTSVTILANNVADGVPHNFALYASQDAVAAGDDPIVETETCSGPCQEQVEVNLDGGQYYFRCEVHGDSMSGTLTAR